jgi:tripartite-type tricarboxylate transporter receptor subunit TctC
VFAPAGTPPDVIARLQKEISAVLAEADIKDFLVGIGAAPVESDPSAFEAMLKADRVANQKIVSKLKLKVD